MFYPPQMPAYKQVQAHELPLHEEVRILEANEDGLIALEKPTGLLSHPNEPDDAPRSLLNAEYNYDEEYFSERRGRRGLPRLARESPRFADVW